MQAVRSHKSGIVFGARRDVEDVDDPHAATPSRLRDEPVRTQDASALGSRIAVIGAVRRRGVIGRGDDKDSIGPRMPQQDIEDDSEVEVVALGRNPLHDVVHADQERGEVRPELLELG